MSDSADFQFCGRGKARALLLGMTQTLSIPEYLDIMLDARLTGNDAAANAVLAEAYHAHDAILFAYRPGGYLMPDPFDVRTSHKARAISQVRDARGLPECGTPTTLPTLGSWSGFGHPIPQSRAARARYIAEVDRALFNLRHSAHDTI